MAGIELTDFQPFRPVGTPDKSVGTRREWRIKQETGELRGISVREKNKARKSVGWYDRESPGWGDILKEYETWRRKPRYAVGTFEQSVRNNDRQPTGKSNRNLPN